jgi:acyl-CoA thioesterase I
VAAAGAEFTGDAARTILFVGTSLTAGLGLDPEQAYPALLQARLDSMAPGWRAVNAGVSGETSAGALRRLEWLIGEGPSPAIVVVETGANDGLRGQSIDSLRANLEAILGRLDRLEPKPRLVVAQMEALPNLGRDYGMRFRGVFAEVARTHGAILMPFLLEGVAGVDSLNQPDGIHPNPAGARRVADNVWRTIGPLISSPS